jgi:hypothetical protein
MCLLPKGATLCTMLALASACRCFVCMCVCVSSVCVSLVCMSLVCVSSVCVVECVKRRCGRGSHLEATCLGKNSARPAQRQQQAKHARKTHRARHARTCRQVVVLSFSMVAVRSIGTPPQPLVLKGWPLHSATKPVQDGVQGRVCVCVCGGGGGGALAFWSAGRVRVCVGRGGRTCKMQPPAANARRHVASKCVCVCRPESRCRNA